MALRDLVMPWHELCPESGLPVAGSETYGPGDRPAAEPVLLPQQGPGARTEPAAPGCWAIRCASSSPTNMDELAHDGWIAVVHADGNGVGTLFQDFPSAAGRRCRTSELSLEEFSYYLGAVSAELEEATCEAFAAAVTAAAGSDRPRDTVLPLVIGGDDVTFACHAGIATPLVREFLDEFHRRTARQETLAELAGQLAGTGAGRAGQAGLTSSAGIAIVKPHHPFSSAYELAADLCENAKVVKTRRSRAFRSPRSTCM